MPRSASSTGGDSPLSHHRKIGIDANVLIYLLGDIEPRAELARQLLARLETGELAGVASVLTLTEVLTGPGQGRSAGRFRSDRADPDDRAAHRVARTRCERCRRRGMGAGHIDSGPVGRHPADPRARLGRDGLRDERRPHEIDRRPGCHPARRPGRGLMSYMQADDLADTYAQTLTYALFMVRLEAGAITDLKAARQAIPDADALRSRMRLVDDRSVSTEELRERFAILDHAR